MEKTFYIHTLGCPKNSVDSQSMATLLMQHGYDLADEQQDAEFIIVNTCGFIQPARQEALNLLQDIVREKKRNQKLIAAGCLTQREKEQVLQEVPEINALLGTRRWMDILSVIQQLEKHSQKPFSSITEGDLAMESEAIVRAALSGGYAYLKIADGCDRGCAFCSIPIIKGPQVSRKLQDILRDVRVLEEGGLQELILIAQDVTSYGRDLGLPDGLPNLLQKIVTSSPSIPWIRLLYTYPGEISEQLMHVMKEVPQVLPYLDIPLQHAHPDVLRRMRRPADMHKVRDLLESMRARIPQLSIRTTFIVGFPGESEQEFETLLDFVREIRFDRVGIFPYYHEAGTPAYAYPDDIPASEKEERIQRLAMLQEGISTSRNEEFIGKELDVIVDGVGDGISVCRSYRDAPEIDGMVMVEDELEVGKITAVKVTAALVHDLIASPLRK
ncbi:MAG TPA: 30S ribosomal protein S12 methylthiotransferase RimO [Anaerolineaceae bacterium]|nr:30S ribosomal protein S12 methylthiotransferase RimO [Anaerolineaceae bacterium]